LILSNDADEIFFVRKQTMIELTERQREALIKLGGSSSFEMIAPYLKKVHKYIVNFTERKIENFSEMI